MSIIVKSKRFCFTFLYVLGTTECTFRCAISIAYVSIETLTARILSVHCNTTLVDVCNITLQNCFHMFGFFSEFCFLFSDVNGHGYEFGIAISLIEVSMNCQNVLNDLLSSTLG